MIERAYAIADAIVRRLDRIIELLDELARRERDRC
jgi:hypothetical protein